MKALQILAGRGRACSACASAACSRPTSARFPRRRRRAQGPDPQRARPASCSAGWLPRSAPGHSSAWAPRSAPGAWPRACLTRTPTPRSNDAWPTTTSRQRYEHSAGQGDPTPRHVSELFAARLVERFGGRAHEVAVASAASACTCSPRARRARARARRARAHADGLLRRLRREQRASRRAMGGLAGARGLLRPARDAARAHARLPHPAGRAERRQPAPAASSRAARSRSGSRPCTTIPGGPRGAVLGRRHHRLPPAPGLRRVGHPGRRLRRRGPRALPALPEDAGARLAGQGPAPPPPRQRRVWPTWCCCRPAPSGWRRCPAARSPIAATSGGLRRRSRRTRTGVDAGDGGERAAGRGARGADAARIPSEALPLP